MFVTYLVVRISLKSGASNWRPNTNHQATTSFPQKWGFEEDLSAWFWTTVERSWALLRWREPVKVVTVWVYSAVNKSCMLLLYCVWCMVIVSTAVILPYVNHRDSTLSTSSCEVFSCWQCGYHIEPAVWSDITSPRSQTYMYTTCAVMY